VVFHNVLDTAFSTWSHVAAMRALQDHAVGLTGREVARLAGMNHRTCLKALATLEGLGVIICRRGGRDHLFSLNRSHLLTTNAILPVLRFEREFPRLASSFLSKQFGPSVESVILFGSVARKDETAGSDFDLCIVVKGNRQKGEAQEVCHAVAQKFQQEFGATLAPFVITRKEFAARATREQPPVPAIIEEGIVLRGKSFRELNNGQRGKTGVGRPRKVQKLSPGR
jgi:predicted nucleotidyltransferase